MNSKLHGDAGRRAARILGAAAMTAVCQGIAASEKPHVILILTDQQTADAMSHCGNGWVSTPAIDQLAKDGICFANAYCAYPLSGPSRASIFTGKMPNALQVLENDDPLPPHEIACSLGFRMKNSGYDCRYAGKWHIPTVNIPDRVFGFRKIANMNDPQMAENIAKSLDEPSDKPLFLVASYLNPHEICEFARAQTLPYGQVTIPPKAPLPPLPHNFDATKNLPELLMLHKEVSPKLYPTRNYTTRDWRNYLYAYYRLVERADAAIGELIAVLKKKGIYHNALILFTSDHGDGMAAHRWNQKRALFEETIRVPLIVKPPGNHPNAGKTNQKALVNIGLDIYTTICHAAGVPLPAELYKGKNLLHAAADVDAPMHESILVETHLDGIDGRAWCVVKGEYKYVYHRFFRNKEQLFHLASDRGETKNLIGRKAFEPIRTAMRNELRKLAETHDDAMLKKELGESDGWPPEAVRLP